MTSLLMRSERRAPPAIGLLQPVLMLVELLTLRETTLLVCSLTLDSLINSLPFNSLDIVSTLFLEDTGAGLRFLRTGSP